MDNRMIRLPVPLLLRSDATASAKVLWMASQLQSPANPAELEVHTGLSRRTIQRALDPAATFSRNSGGPWVKVPAALLRDRSVSAHAKVLYGLLQTTPGFRGQKGHFTYAALCAVTGWGPNTLKRAIAKLKDAHWIRSTQRTRLSPLHFTLGSPALRRALAESVLAERRLKRAQYGGEAIMQEYLSLVVDSTQFIDNARPGFMINPLTGERLEFDRYYEQPSRVAFEFHGAQHFGATAKVTEAQAEEQRIRDLIKAGLCVYEEIRLVVVQTEDLSLQGMIQKIGGLLPLRDLAGREPLIDLLERASMTYQAEAAVARKAARTGANGSAR